MNSILSVRKDSVSKEGRRRKSSVATVVEVEEDTDMATKEEKPEKLAAPAVKSEEVIEVRSKSLLEKDNKKLQAEIERLKDEFQKMQDGGQPAPEIMNSILSVRKDSVSKEGRRRKSSVATVVEVEEDTDMDE